MAIAWSAGSQKMTSAEVTTIMAKTVANLTPNEVAVLAYALSQVSYNRVAFANEPAISALIS